MISELEALRPLGARHLTMPEEAPVARTVLTAELMIPL